MLRTYTLTASAIHGTITLGPPFSLSAVQPLCLCTDSSAERKGLKPCRCAVPGSSEQVSTDSGGISGGDTHRPTLGTPCLCLRS